ncbi:MAG: stage II sporulation protein R [Oscillospiraceae bacterium]|jgi:stage II sporulation protein R|nr:stage II sporulation protein R [Oscillospiraceae bacterium]
MKLKKWETALAAALSLTFLCGAALAGEQSELSDKIIRLHVVANSDSPEDQAIKLEARDSVLASLGPILDGARGADEAARRTIANLGAIEDAAKSAVPSGTEVRAELTSEYFPTREYETFSLPAGRYTSLRVTLGQGAGQNWWCVVFPPLCAPDSGEGIGDLLTDGEVALITEEDAGCVVKFKAIELIGRIRNWLGAD